MAAMPDTSIRVDELPSGQPVQITDRYEIIRTSGQVPGSWHPAPAPPTISTVPQNAPPPPVQGAPGAWQPGAGPPPTSVPIVPPTLPLPAPVPGAPVRFQGTPVQAAESKAEPQGGRALAVCLVLYLAAATLPVLCSLYLLTDENYMFWIGPFYPELLLVSVIGIALVMVFTFSLTGRFAPGYLQTRNCTITMISLFAGMLGITLILISLPQSRAIYDIANRIGHGCMNSLVDSNMLMDVDTVLYNIKGTPQCQSHESVEDCPGWSSNRYTRYIQYMEDQFNCGPLCTEMEAPMVGAPAPASLIAMEAHRTPARRLHQKQVRTEKLFTEGYARTPCFTKVAAQMEVLGWCYSDRMFWEGMSLLFVSFLASLFFFIHQCTSKPKSGSY